MQVRVWNAYASNNSGSYTIVGRLPSAEIAEATATELREMIAAHTAWLADWDGASSLATSPLAGFCRTHGLTWAEGTGGADEWPEYAEDNRPQVVVSGAQIVVHHDATVTLPSTFGELFYKRGGRVQHEEDHAHGPLVVTAQLFWGWQDDRKAVQAREQPRLLAALTGPGGLLTAPNAHAIPAAWRTHAENALGWPLTVGVVFDDLVTGIAALRAAAEAHDAKLEIALAEAVADDPLAHLRPSTPAVPRFDVVVTAAGPDRAAVARALAPLALRFEHDVRQRLQRAPPVTIARAVFESPARAAAAAAEAAGARVELQRNDG